MSGKRLFVFMLLATAVFASPISAFAKTGGFVIAERSGVRRLVLESRNYSPGELARLIGGRSDLVVESRDREHPAVVSGGRTISGWTVGTDGVWRATLPEVKTGAWNFSALFVNGARRYRPSMPQEGWYETVKGVDIVKGRPGQRGTTGGMVYGGDAIDPSWANFGDLELNVIFQWNGARLRIGSVDRAARTVRFAEPHRSAAVFHGFAGRRFRIENVKEAFGRAGEWYLDRPTGVLAYRPLPGETPDGCVVEAPVEPTLLAVDGQTNVVFRNLVFRLDNHNTPCAGEFDNQADYSVAAAATVTASRGIAFEGCVFANLGGWAVAFGPGATASRVAGCTMADLGAGGVRIGSVDRTDTDRITVEDCEISEGGRRNPGAPAILVQKSSHNRILRNHIHHMYYTGVSAGWDWSGAPTTANHNEIAYNRIHDLGLKLLSDMGFVYLLGRQPGTRVHHNFCDRISHYQYGSDGLYPDEHSAGVELDHNYVADAGQLFHTNMGLGLDVHDNVFVGGTESQLRYSSDCGVTNGLISLKNNTFVWNCGVLIDRTKPFKGDPAEIAAWNPPAWLGVSALSNVYWRADGRADVFPGRRTLAEYQAASGIEKGSVWRDPGPIDPATVTGPTGPRPDVVRARWTMPATPRPYGDIDLVLVQREAHELSVFDGVENIKRKLMLGKDVTVAYFGGSITEGTSWRPSVTRWLRGKYPRSKITEVNAGIGGTASGLGVFRLGHDVLVHRPDLVFVEFACNDYDLANEMSDGRAAANLEEIVRQIWRQDLETDIVFVYTVTKRMLPSYSRDLLDRYAAIHDSIARRYYIPSVTFAPRVMAEARTGRLVWTLGDFATAVPKEDPAYDRKVGAELTAAGKIVFSNDGVHPRAEGGAFYFASVTNLFAAPTIYPTPANRRRMIELPPFAPSAYARAVSLAVDPKWLVGTGWSSVAADDRTFGRFLPRTDAMVTTDTPGDGFSFEFTGRFCALYALYGPTGAKLRVTVDGRDAGTRDLCDRYCNYWRLMCVPVFDGAWGRHRVEVRVLEEQPDRMKIVFRGVAPEVLRGPAYDGHRFALGRVFIDGRLPSENDSCGRRNCP